MTTALTAGQAGELAGAVLQRVSSVVIGKSDPLKLVLAGILAGGHVLLEDFPGLGKTLAARSFAQTLGLEFTRAQFTPDLLPADLTGSFIYDQRIARVRVPPGPVVHRPPARRRDQPHPAQDPGRPAGGDAGAPGHRRGPHLPAGRAVPRARDGQPGRVRRHLPAARGAARPVPAAGGASATRPPRRSTTSCAAGSRGVARRPCSSPSSTPPACWRCRPPSRRSRSTSSVAEYCVALATASRSHRDVLVGASPRGSLA